MARPEYTFSSFHDIALSLASIPGYKAKEFQEEIAAAKYPHELTAKNVIKICLIELFDARFVIVSDFDDN